MNLIFVSDIFGKTEELLTLCELFKSSFDIIDPYSGKQMHFKDESDAYEFFITNVGIQTYSEILKNFLNTVTESSILIGFSIGATAIWSISENLNRKIIQCAVCFYSSQIRNYMSVRPAIETELIFPESEPKFSVQEISEHLSKKKNVNVHNTVYLHGFMNKLSENFDRDGYQEYTDWIFSIIR